MRNRARVGLVLFVVIAFLFVFCGSILAGNSLLPTKGDRVAFVGDSLTAQNIYTKFMDAYFKACVPQLELTAIQCGRDGETAHGFKGRLKSDVLPWKPDLVTICYGMNDGGYDVFKEDLGKKYSESLQEIVSVFKSEQDKIIVSSPGVVDSKYFPPSFVTTSQEVYNKTLVQMSDLARQVASNNSAGAP